MEGVATARAQVRHSYRSTTLPVGMEMVNGVCVGFMERLEMSLRMAPTKKASQGQGERGANGPRRLAAGSSWPFQSTALSTLNLY